MAVTNAISGLTAVGGMSLLAHSAQNSDSIIPNGGAGWAGAIALLLSCVNIVGGFEVSGKVRVCEEDACVLDIDVHSQYFRT